MRLNLTKKLSNTKDLSLQPDKGHLFEIPITVVKPEPLSSMPRPSLSVPKAVFTAGAIKRNFCMVPENASWAVVR